MNHIQPFYIFEGLLKPRDISGRKEQHKANVIHTHPDQLPFTNKHVNDIVRSIAPYLHINLAKRDTISQTIYDDDYLLELTLIYQMTKARQSTILMLIQLEYTNRHTYDLSIDTIESDGLSLITPIAKYYTTHDNLSTQELIDIIKTRVKKDIKL